MFALVQNRIQLALSLGHGEGATHSGSSKGPLWYRLWWITGLGMMLALVLVVTNLGHAKSLTSHPSEKILFVPILGTSLNRQGEPTGVVVTIEIQFALRPDHQGLHVTFEDKPGNLSSFSKQAVIQATWYAALAARLQPDSWDVTLTNPFPGVTIYGDSLSAMVGLSVVALAKGDPLLPGRAMTGTITQQGDIGKVGGVPYKIAAAYDHRIQRVLIPEEQDVADGDWQTPFLMQVSPVGTIAKAYRALTDRPL